MGQKVTLDGRRKIAIHALACGSTKQAAADRASVSRKTVHKWLQEPEFREEYERVREMLAAAELESTLGYFRERLESRRWALRRLRALAERDDVPLALQSRVLSVLLDAEGVAGELQRLLVEKNDPLAKLQLMKPVSIDLSQALAEGLVE